jgi:hypothetical protein
VLRGAAPAAALAGGLSVRTMQQTSADLLNAPHTAQHLTHSRRKFHSLDAADVHKHKIFSWVPLACLYVLFSCSNCSAVSNVFTLRALLSSGTCWPYYCLARRALRPCMQQQQTMTLISTKPMLTPMQTMARKYWKGSTQGVCQKAALHASQSQGRADQAASRLEAFTVCSRGSTRVCFIVDQATPQPEAAHCSYAVLI